MYKIIPEVVVLAVKVSCRAPYLIDLNRKYVEPKTDCYYDRVESYREYYINEAFDSSRNIGLDVREELNYGLAVSRYYFMVYHKDNDHHY